MSYSNYINMYGPVAKRPPSALESIHLVLPGVLVALRCTNPLVECQKVRRRSSYRSVIPGRVLRFRVILWLRSTSIYTFVEHGTGLAYVSTIESTWLLQLTNIRAAVRGQACPLHEYRSHLGHCRRIIETISASLRYRNCSDLLDKGRGAVSYIAALS